MQKKLCNANQPTPLLVSGYDKHFLNIFPIELNKQLKYLTEKIFAHE